MTYASTHQTAWSERALNAIVFTSMGVVLGLLLAQSPLIDTAGVGQVAQPVVPVIEDWHGNVRRSHWSAD